MYVEHVCTLCTYPICMNCATIRYSYLKKKNGVANYTGNKFKEFLLEMVLKIGDFTHTKLVYLFFNVICC